MQFIALTEKLNTTDPVKYWIAYCTNSKESGGLIDYGHPDHHLVKLGIPSEFL